MYLSVYWVSQLISAQGEMDQILFKMDQDYQSDGFVNGGYPKPGDIPLLNRKIFRGVRVSPREHPYVASIRRMYAHYSTGTLITKNLVITVAHPVFEVNISELGVVIGQSYCDRGTLIATVVLMIIHEDFDPYTLVSDLALLRLYEDQIFKAAVKPIGFVSRQEKLNDLNAFVTGWGRCDRTGKELCIWRSTEYNPDEKLDPMLRSISFKIVIPNFYCEGYNRQEVYLKPGMMCLGPAREEDPVAPCLAVPGAPLVVKSRLAGMLSWGFGCGYSFDLPLIYTDVRYYYGWLLHNVPILRKIPRKNLTEIFDATRAYVLNKWLLRTRQDIPNPKQYISKDIVSLDVDFKLATLRGSVYDIRDFINNGMYHDKKIDMYNAIIERDNDFNKKLLSMKEDKTADDLSQLKTDNVDTLLIRNENFNDLGNTTNDFNPLPPIINSDDNYTTGNHT